MSQANRSSAKLKLADYSKPLTRSPDALYFERRRGVRHRLTGRATALLSGTTHRICALQLHDQSDAGLGALADAPVEVGRTITVFFPPHGEEPGFNVCGCVVRCRPVDDRFDVGISLAQRLAA